MSDADIGVVLVPVDGSEGSRKAARFAETVAAALSVPLELLYAFPRNAIEMFGPPGEAATENQIKYLSEDAFAELREDSSRRVFEDARRVLDGKDVSIKEVLLAGEPADSVLEHAGGARDPLIIVGSRGMSRFRGLLLGSVSQKLVHHARCPVTVVR